MLNNSNVFDLFLQQLGKSAPILAFQIYKNYEISLISNSKNFFTLVHILKKHVGYQYTLLSCISGVDLLNKNYRFLVSYELLSINFSTRLRIKLFGYEYNYIQSLYSLVVNSNWWEREIWDL